MLPKSEQSLVKVVLCTNGLGPDFMFITKPNTAYLEIELSVLGCFVSRVAVRVEIINNSSVFPSQVQKQRQNNAYRQTHGKQNVFFAYTDWVDNMICTVAQWAYSHFSQRSLETLIKAKPVLLKLPVLPCWGEENLTRKKRLSWEHWISPSSSQSAIMFFHR